MSAPDDRPTRTAQPIACDLGVTGKRLRRALPPVVPAADFRARLRLQLLETTPPRKARQARNAQL